jgi:hypothetical protein
MERGVIFASFSNENGSRESAANLLQGKGKGERSDAEFGLEMVTQAIDRRRVRNI